MITDNPANIKSFNRTFLLLAGGILLKNLTVFFPEVYFDMYTVWIGHLLFFLALRKLRKINRRLIFAFICSILILILSTVSYWAQTVEYISTLHASYIFSIFIIRICEISFLFTGLRQIAKNLENEKLYNKFTYNLIVCLINFFLSAFSLFFVFGAVISIFLTVGNMFFLFSAVKELRKTLDQHGWPENITQAFLPIKFPFPLLATYLITTFIVTLALLYHVSTPHPKYSLHSQEFISEEAERGYSNLSSFGMSDFIIKDLSEDELSNYSKMYDYNQSSQTIQIDGGELEIIRCASTLSSDFRIICYYKWTKSPEHHYIDLIGFIPSFELLPIEKEIELQSASLFDIESVTYTQEPISLEASDYFVYLVYRLYPNYNNQRGYLAYNLTSAFRAQHTDYDLSVKLAHQVTIFNQPHIDIYRVFSWQPSQNIFETFNITFSERSAPSTL